MKPESVALSLRLHAALIPYLLRDPDSVVAKARFNIAGMRSSGTGDRSERYLQAWEEIIDAGVESILETFRDTSDHGVTLRSCTPFAGVLPPSEVDRIRSESRESRTRRGPIEPHD
jgi:hypothetical protein